MIKKCLMVAMAAACCLMPLVLKAQVNIAGTHYSFTFPSSWKYLQTTRVDHNTNVYLYSYNERFVVDAKGDTALPNLRIYVRKNYQEPVYSLVFSRYMKNPYQSLNDYTSGPGLPKEGGIGYEGIYTNVEEAQDYQFRMVYFKEKNTIVEFRLETTMGTYPQMEAEFLKILQSITAN